MAKCHHKGVISDNEVVWMDIVPADIVQYSFETDISPSSVAWHIAADAYDSLLFVQKGCTQVTKVGCHIGETLPHGSLAKLFIEGFQPAFDDGQY
jgi:hypothetical protein